ncbi:carboxymuconolactone decarboxylase family protein [Candidatus Bipolaricaulota bacterium]|nr:carboxymuconolactone decarboxylase family protein [Candidatus Bipolaricaulota bacterium]
MGKAEAFFSERARLNELVLKHGNLTIKRSLALDGDAYEDGALPRKTKELMGLVASLVLRCDDCVTYHLVQARLAGAMAAEITEAMAIALVVGGSIVIPHLRRGVELLAELEEGNADAGRDRD